MKRRTFIAACASAELALVGATARAQSWPARQVRLVVPYPPGGGNDTLGRLVGAKLGERIGTTIVVENRPGAGTLLGADAVAKSPPDGYTLLLSSIATHALSPNLYAKVPYDPLRDFVGVSLIGIAPMVVIVPSEFAARSLAELIAGARTRPGALAYGSGGSGSPTHIAGELLKVAADIDLLHVPYKGGGPAMIDLIAGRIQVIIDTTASALPHIQAGRVRALAITGVRRSPALPDVPTCAEAGLPQFDANAWYSVHAPAATPPDTLRRLSAEVAAVLKDPEVDAQLRKLGTDPAGLSGEALDRFVRDELDKYARLIRRVGIRVE
jgi:tripartite-type tricarboxylate transporter receptor subunit TctC